jgi:hypothetical protein
LRSDVRGQPLIEPAVTRKASLARPAVGRREQRPRRAPAGVLKNPIRGARAQDVPRLQAETQFL